MEEGAVLFYSSLYSGDITLEPVPAIVNVGEQQEKEKGAMKKEDMFSKKFPAQKQKGCVVRTKTIL